MNTFGRSFLKYLTKYFLNQACYQALGQVCKFIQRCKKIIELAPGWKNLEPHIAGYFGQMPLKNRIMPNVLF